MNLKKLLLLLFVLALVVFGYFMLRSINWGERPSDIGQRLETEEEVIEMPTSPYPGIDNLYEAVEARHLPAVRYFLDQGADVNELFRMSGLTPLMTAARDGDEKMIDLLLQRGANVTMRNAQGQSAADIAWERRRNPGPLALYAGIAFKLEKAGAPRQAGND